MKPVSMETLARRAGVSRSTVSRALRSNPRLRPETRERIQRMAAEMGYRPDPMLSALVSLRGNGPVLRENGSVIACVTHTGATDGRVPRMLAALRTHCAAAGYRIEEFPLSRYGSERRLHEVLWNRGVSGVVVIANILGINLDAVVRDRLPAVVCGYHPQSIPGYHVVADNHFNTVRMAYDRLKAEGIDRVGNILCGCYMDGDRIRDGAVRHFRRNAGSASAVIPVLYTELTGKDLEAEREVILRWYEAHRPDAVVGLFSRYYFRMLEAGIRIPEDVRFIALTDLQPPECRRVAAAGIRGMAHAEVAVELIQSEIRKFHRGRPSTPCSVYVEPSWRPGESFPEAGGAGANYPVVPPDHWSRVEGVEINAGDFSRLCGQESPVASSAR